MAGLDNHTRVSVVLLTPDDSRLFRHNKTNNRIEHTVGQNQWLDADMELRATIVRNRDVTWLIRGRHSPLVCHPDQPPFVLPTFSGTGGGHVCLGVPSSTPPGESQVGVSAFTVMGYVSGRVVRETLTLRLS